MFFNPLEYHLVEALLKTMEAASSFQEHIQSQDHQNRTNNSIANTDNMNSGYEEGSTISCMGREQERLEFLESIVAIYFESI